MTTETKDTKEEIVKSEAVETQQQDQVSETENQPLQNQEQPEASVETTEVAEESKNEIDPLAEEVDDNEVQHKIDESNQRLYGNVPRESYAQPSVPQYQQPQYQPQAPVQQQKQWYSDFELNKMLESNPDLGPQVEAHKRERDQAIIEERITQRLTNAYQYDQTRRISEQQVLNQFPQLNNPKSRLSVLTSQILRKDPNLSGNPRAFELAVYEAYTKISKGQIENAFNQGRSDASKQRRILGKVIVEKQTAPAPVATSKFKLSDQERKEAAYVGMSEEDYSKARDKATKVMNNRQRRMRMDVA